MPVVNLSPIARRQYFDSNGDPVVGGLLFYYAAGSSTKQSTYTDSSGTVANSNPIVLDASGRTPQGVWFEAGLIYKEVLALATDTDPPTSPIYTADGLEGVNDTTTPAALASSSQWVASGLTPTYVSATQFTLVGDQTAAFHVGRRLRLTVTAGTVYGRISVTAFGALTTVTVVLDSGALDAGLSAVDVGILTALNESMPEPSSVGYQPLDGLLTALAAQTTAANNVQSYSGADTPALLSTGTASGNIPLVGTVSATEVLAGLSRRSTTIEAQAGVEDTAHMTALKTAQAKIVLGTKQDSTSGVAIDFTGISATVKRIVVMFENVSTNGTGQTIIQLGDSGGFETTGYASSAFRINSGGTVAATVSTGLMTGNEVSAADVRNGMFVLEKLTGDTWVGSGVFSSAGGQTCCAAGAKTLSGTLTQLRITTTSGDTFDLGQINISVE